MVFSRTAARAAMAITMALVGQGLDGRALADDAPRTGRVEVIVRSPIPQGVDGWMPRDGAYARGLAAAGEGRWRLAAQQFLAAAAEARKAGEAAMPCAAAVRNADRRCEAQSVSRLHRVLRKIGLAQASAQLLSDAGPLAPAPGAKPAAPFSPAIEERLREAIAEHDLYLASRAFHGRDQPRMRARVERAYRDTLDGIAATDQSPITARLRLGLAAILADGGQRGAAAAEFARVPIAERSPDNVDLVAHYHAAMGEAAAAFDALAAARDTLGDWGDVAAVFRVSNDLDLLRGDPRLRSLLGDD